MLNFNKLSYIFFTQKCFSCGNTIKYESQTYLLCENCLKSIIPVRLNNYSKCIKCSGHLYKARENSICYNCYINNFYFNKNTSLFYYSNTLVKELVHKFKFESNKHAGIDLSFILKPEITYFLSNNNYDIITIVPLSKKSLKTRGFNQVEFILNQCGIKYSSILLRKEHKRHQSQLTGLERKELIKGQFEIKNEYSEILKDKSILVIDDIYTTGSTSNEISTLFLDNKVKSIDILTFFHD